MTLYMCVCLTKEKKKKACLNIVTSPTVFKSGLTFSVS